MIYHTCLWLVVFFYFLGNSVSAIMDGCGRLTFLKRGEDYTITMPYAHCKGQVAHRSHKVLILGIKTSYGGVCCHNLQGCVQTESPVPRPLNLELDVLLVQARVHHDNKPLQIGFNLWFWACPHHNSSHWTQLTLDIGEDTNAKYLLLLVQRVHGNYIVIN